LFDGEELIYIPQPGKHFRTEAEEEMLAVK
jgi:hypothetical protein